MEWLVLLHSWWRYLVVLAALAAFVLALLAYTGTRPWDALADRLGLILADYSRSNTFLTWLHPLLMIGVVALAHIGRVRSERAGELRSKGAQAALFFGLALVVMAVGIPTASWLAPGQ
jgi:hypothetical protein